MMTLDFWIRLPFAALIICAVYSLFAPKMLLGAVADWLEKRVPEWYLKPVFACPVCMPSIYGTAAWFWTGGDWLWWCPFVLALCGLMRLISDNLIK